MDNGDGADGTVQFINTVGANDDLDVIDITGNLNLDAAISNTTSLSYLVLLILVQMLPLHPLKRIPVGLPYQELTEP